MAVTAEDVTREMRDLVAGIIGIEPGELDIDRNLRLEYGLTSIDAAELIMIMEERYGIVIALEDAQRIQSTRDAIDFVLSRG